MRTRSLFLLSSGLLFGTSALTGVAYAQKGIALEPKTQWAVSQVGGASDTAYCAIARRFDKNVIMTLARNKNNENSIALDFQTGNFEKGKSYNVFLDPGAGQQRQFNTKPVSEKAFVFKIGTDYPFLNALDRTGYMRVEIDREIFNLNLADIDKGQADLEKCVRGGHATAQAAANSTGLSSASAENDAQVQAKLRALESENAKLKSRIQQQVDSAPRPSLTIQDQGHIERFKTQIAELESENNRLQKLYMEASNAQTGAQGAAVANLAKENMRLQTLLDQMQTQQSSANEVSVLNERLTSLESENATLTQKLKVAQDAAIRVGSLEKELARALADKDALANMAAAESARAQEAKSGTLSSLENENKKLSERIATLRAENTNVLAQLDDLKSENATLRVRLTETTEAASKAADSELLAQLRSQIKMMEQSNSKELSLKNSEISKLQNLIADNKASLEAAMKQQTMQKAELEQELERVQAQLQQERESYEAKLQSVKAEKHASSEQLEQMNSEMASLRLSLESSSVEEGRYLAQLDEANKELAALKSAYELALLNDEAMQQKLSTLESSNAEHQARVVSLETERAMLLNSIETAAGDDAAAQQASQEKLAQLEQEKARALEQLAEIREEALTAKEKLNILMSERSDMEERIASLISGKGASEDQISLLMRDRDEAVNSLKVLQEERDALQRRYNVLEAEIASIKQGYEDRIASLESEKEEMSQQYALLEEQVRMQEHAYAEEIEALQQNINSLLIENKALTHAMDSAEVMNQQLQAMNQDAMSRIEGAKAQIAELAENVGSDAAKGELEAIQAENDKLRENLKVQEAQMVALVQAQNSVNVDQVVSDIDTERHNAEMAAMVQKNRDLQAALARLEKAVSGKEDAVRSDMQTPESAQADIEPVITEQQAGQEQETSATREVITQLSAIEPASGSETNQSSATEPHAEDDALEMKPAAVVDEVVEVARYETAAQAQEAAMKQAMKKPHVMEHKAVSAPSEKTIDDVVSHVIKEETVERAAVVGEAKEPVSEEVFNAVEQREAIVQAEVEPASKHTASATSSDIAAILASADVALDGPVQMVEEASQNGALAYQWRGGNVYGSAMQKPTNGDDDFDAQVRSYLEKTESRCTGDFAVTPSLTSGQGASRIDGYEIACVGNGVDSSASLLFYNKDGLFTVLAHEASVSDMGVAMDMRDRIAETIKKARI